MCFVYERGLCGIPRQLHAPCCDRIQIRRCPNSTPGCTTTRSLSARQRTGLSPQRRLKTCKVWWRLSIVVTERRTLSRLTPWSGDFGPNDIQRKFGAGRQVFSAASAASQSTAARRQRCAQEDLGSSAHAILDQDGFSRTGSTHARTSSPASLNATLMPLPSTEMARDDHQAYSLSGSPRRRALSAQNCELARRLSSVTAQLIDLTRSGLHLQDRISSWPARWPAR